MSVTVVKGRCGSGKSRFLISRIRMLIQDPFKKVIVIVPGQLTFETEKNIIQTCGVEGIFGLQVMSVQRLAYKILEDTASHTFITNAEKAMICNKALHQLDNPYHGTAQLPDFDSCVADLISRLKSYNQTPEGLRSTASKTTDEALRQKLYDTADVFEQYKVLSEGRPDSTDMYAAAAAKADEADFLKDAHIIIDGLDSFCPAVMLLISKVIALSSETIAAFRSEGEGGDSDLFTSERKDMEQFVTAAKRAGKKVEEFVITGLEPRYTCDELAFLESNLYKYPYDQYTEEVNNIQLYETESIAHEVDILASGILTEVKRGKRFRDMAVAVGGIDAYAPMIKTKFALCGIPFFIDERRTLSDNTFFDFVYKAICAAAGDMMAVTGYIYSSYSLLDEEAQYVLKQYAKRYAYKGWHYQKAFWRGDDADQAETLRRLVMQPLLILEEGIKATSAKKQVDAIKQFLKTCDASGKLEAFCDRLQEQYMMHEYEYFAQVHDKIMDVITGISDVFGDMMITPQELCGLFKAGCDATKIAVIPPTTDEVGIFDISLARLKNVDVLFAMGVQDGVWPAKDDAPGIISSSERDALYDMGMDIGVYDLSAEKLKIYTALVKPCERLYISYNTESGQPSVLIDRLKRIFPLLETQKGMMATTSLKGMQTCVLGEISEYLRGADGDEELLSVCAKYLEQESWKEKASKLLLRTNQAETIGAEAAAKLYGGIRCSATRIENYYRCPFRHFLDNGIKVQVEREYIGDRVDIGTFMHLALDIFTRKLINDRMDIKALTQEQTVKRMDEAAKQAAVEHDNGKLMEDERFAVQYHLLVDELTNTALRIRTHFEGTNAKIFMSEQAFAEYTIPTLLGDITLSGKIDRIDVSDDHFRVVDYKSSSTGFSLGDFAGGVSLQLPIYIEAARRLLQSLGIDALPAGGYYMKIGDVYKESDEAVAKAARMTGISLNDAEVLREFSGVADSGSFNAIDQSVTRAGCLHGRGQNKFFTGDELNVLLNKANRLIKEAAEDIYTGSTAIRPAVKMSKGDACTYCAYTGVCRFDSEYEGNEVRELVHFDKALLAKEADNER